MDKIEILQKHYAAFPELKAKKPPREPKKPVILDSKRTKEINSPAFKKARDSWLKKMENYQKKYKAWDFEESRKTKVRQLLVTGDGVAQAGSAYRLVRLAGVPNEMEEDYFLGSDGEGYPDFNRIVNILPYPQEKVFLNVKDFKGMILTLEKACEYLRLSFKNVDGKSFIEFTPVKKVDFDANFESAKLEIDAYPAFQEFSFAINPKHLSEVFKLASTLKLQNLELQFITAIKPVRFVGEDFFYLLTPIRTN